MDKRALIVFGIIFIVVVFAALFILSLSRSAQNRREDVTREVVEGGRETIPALDVVGDPLVYDGLTIEVEAPISDWVTKKAFTVSTGQRSGILRGGNLSELLIITKGPISLPKDADGKELGLGELVNVRITGRSRIMSKIELARELGIRVEEDDFDESDIRLDDNKRIINWKEGSVVIAERIEKL